MFEKFKRRRAIQQYRKKLGPHLAATYGSHSTYEPAQVYGSIDQLGLSMAAAAYALALYCDRSSFEQDTLFGQHYNYADVQTELAQQAAVASEGIWTDVITDAFDGVTDNFFDGDSGGDGGGDGGGD